MLKRGLVLGEKEVTAFRCHCQVVLLLREMERMMRDFTFHNHIEKLHHGSISWNCLYYLSSYHALFACASSDSERCLLGHESQCSHCTDCLIDYYFCHYLNLSNLAQMRKHLSHQELQDLFQLSENLILSYHLSELYLLVLQIEISSNSI